MNVECIAMCQKLRRILLLSNNHQDFGRVFQLGLEAIADWQVSVANLQLESIAVVEALQPDIILLDTTLPNLEGFHSIKTIATYCSNQNIPLFWLTERIRLADRKLYQDLGITNAIAKPFDTFDLAEQIASKLD